MRRVYESVSIEEYMKVNELFEEIDRSLKVIESAALNGQPQVVTAERQYLEKLLSIAAPAAEAIGAGARIRYYEGEIKKLPLWERIAEIRRNPRLGEERFLQAELERLLKVLR